MRCSQWDHFDRDRHLSQRVFPELLRRLSPSSEDEDAGPDFGFDPG